MEAAAIPAEHREWVARLRQGGPTPMQSPNSHPPAPNTSWACPLPHVFSVRGPDYLTTKAKIPASHCLLHPLAFDSLHGPSQIAHIMNHPHSRVRAALDAALSADGHPQHQPFVWAFNFQLGNRTHHSLVYYFVTFTSPPEGSLMQAFLDGDDVFRNGRLKVLTRFPQAPRLVQLVLGERWPVCMVGKLMKCTYMREQHYIEVDVDLGSSIITRTAISLTFGLSPLVTGEMAFVLEGIHPNELPERILGAMRLVKLQPSSATHLDMAEVTTHVISHKSMMSNCTKPKPAKLSSFSAKDTRAAGFKMKRIASKDTKDEGGEECL